MIHEPRVLVAPLDNLVALFVSEREQGENSDGSVVYDEGKSYVAGFTALVSLVALGAFGIFPRPRYEAGGAGADYLPE
jgi:hypothetical protein